MRKVLGQMQVANRLIRPGLRRSPFLPSAVNIGDFGVRTGLPGQPPVLQVLTPPREVYRGLLEFPVANEYAPLASVLPNDGGVDQLELQPQADGRQMLHPPAEFMDAFYSNLYTGYESEDAIRVYFPPEMRARLVEDGSLDQGSDAVLPPGVSASERVGGALEPPKVPENTSYPSIFPDDEPPQEPLVAAVSVEEVKKKGLWDRIKDFFRAILNILLYIPRKIIGLFTTQKVVDGECSPLPTSGSRSLKNTYDAEAGITHGAAASDINPDSTESDLNPK